MFQRILRFILTLVLKYLKSNKVTSIKSIEDLINDNILDRLSYSKKLTVLNNNKPLVIKYQIEFKGDLYLDFALDYTSGNLDVLFDDTNITDLNFLAETLHKLDYSLQIDKQTISNYFYVHIHNYSK